MKVGFGCFGVSSGDPEAVANVVFVVDVSFEAKFLSVGPGDEAELS